MLGSLKYMYVHINVYMYMYTVHVCVLQILLFETLLTYMYMFNVHVFVSKYLLLGCNESAYVCTVSSQSTPTLLGGDLHV